MVAAAANLFHRCVVADAIVLLAFGWSFIVKGGRRKNKERRRCVASDCRYTALTRRLSLSYALFQGMPGKRCLADLRASFGLWGPVGAMELDRTALDIMQSHAVGRRKCLHM